jgi:hypothetical protein
MKIKSSVAVAYFFPGWAKDLTAPLYMYMGADKSLARSTCRCILLDGENISFDASLSFLVGLRTYQHPYTIIVVYISEAEKYF